jgi:catechol 2,3-dioxygenase-like lactoylglutathione lyase family enzyme
MPRLLINIDVDDLDRAVAFYTHGLGLSAARRFSDGAGAELVGADVTLWLLAQPAGTAPFRDATVRRNYVRHWTPVHLDFVVDDIAAALERALAAGATLEVPIGQHAYGKLAVLADPFGHGFCLLQLEGRGYDEVAG